MTFYEWQDAPRADYAVIGDPVSHSRSPQMHEAAHRARGMSAEYLRIRVPSGELDKALGRLLSLGYSGVNVTVPLKEEAFAWARKIPAQELRMGVVNTLRLSDRAAINTDGPGFLDSIIERRVTSGAQVLVLGAGGTTRALTVCLESAGYRLKLWNRTPENLQGMLGETGVSGECLETPDPTDCDLIVNTTSASLQGLDLPVAWELATPGAIAYDVFYSSEPTPFLQSASNAGLQVVDGRDLLVAQGARSFEWWTGHTAPRADMMVAVQ